jgi:hypothetical protein|tara:strand:+ start:335 stop:826 length:492 start_codon:yes stop_codon:yes gene_type:complete
VAIFDVSERPRKPREVPRCVLTLGQKKEIFEFKKEHENMSNNRIAQFFSKKYNVEISKNVIQRISKINGFELAKNDILRKKMKHPIVSQFEEELYHKLLEEVKYNTLTYENIVFIAKTLQTEKYSTEENIMKIKFSSRWFMKYQDRHNISLISRERTGRTLYV